VNYEEFASDLPLHGTIAVTSAEENEETMRRYGVTQEFRQTGKGKFRSELALRSTEGRASLKAPGGCACAMGRAADPGRSTVDQPKPNARGCPGGYGGAVRAQRPIWCLGVGARPALVLE
jgi:hypothetical protein